MEEGQDMNIPFTEGEVREEKEEPGPEIDSIHITQDFQPEAGHVELGGSERTRTESNASACSDTWQTNEEMTKKLRRAQGLLDNGATPLQIIVEIFPEFDVSRIKHLPERAHMNLLSELFERTPTREKLTTYNSLADAVELFRTRKNILVLTGAGVSVSCGIPDFRSKDGIYARLRSEFPDLPDPTAMFDIGYFRNNPAPFYNFAREIFPGQFVPSVSHRFIRELENAGRLLRNYTQNIDTLEHQTGIKRVVECHGSFSKCTCTRCGQNYDGDAIREEVLDQRVAYCQLCQGVIKPNIVFFGEDLGREFHKKVTEDKSEVDLVVVIGSSLKVRPVSLIPHCVGKDVPQILINRESLSHYHADIELLGNCDEIIRDICFSLGGSFAEMVNDYDTENSSKQASSSARSKRQLITQEEFLSFCLKRRNDSNEPTKEVDLEAPNSKKPRLSSDCEKGDSRKNFVEIQKHDEEKDEETQDSDEVLHSITASKLLDLNSLLEENKCVAISAHQTVFPGAEYSFDLETLKLVRDVHHDNNYDSSSCSSDDDSQGSSSPLSRSTSVDDILYNEYRKSNPIDVIIRCDSCEMSFEYELSELVDAKTFRQQFEEKSV